MPGALPARSIRMPRSDNTLPSRSTSPFAWIPDVSMTALPIMDASSLWILSVAALIAGGIASIAGFGIGSVLTPTLSVWVDARLAVAAISIPHLVATALRFWLLPGGVDRRVLWSFGIASAAGGIAGALLNTVFTSPALLMLLAVLLLFVAAGELTGFSRRLVFRGRAAWIAGPLSGALAG